MANAELESHIDMAFTTIQDSERYLKGVMRMVYRDLDRMLRESPGDLPQGMGKKGRWRIVTFPGNPRDTAIALRPDGSFDYTQWGFSRRPNEFDLPITGPRYFDITVETLRLLRSQ